MSSAKLSSQTGVDGSSPEKNVEAAPSLEQTYMEGGLGREDAVFLASFPEDMRTKCIRKVSKSLQSICNPSNITYVGSRLIGVSALC